jgi:hypothetical protein
MIGRSVAVQATEPLPARPWLEKPVAEKYGLLSWLFGRTPVIEAVSTRAHFDASPAAIWNRMMFYEELPASAPFLLRVLLPHPVRTEGDKTQVSSTIRCVYSRGYLVKSIRVVEPLYKLQFEVIEQRLGIENCILTLGGSYRIEDCGDTTDVVLTTKYQAYLRPRRLWRPLEALLVRSLHSHVLRGVGDAARTRNSAIRLAVAKSLTPQCARSGDLGCTTSQSSFRR